MKKLKYILLTVLFCLPHGMMAQVEEDESDYQDDEDVVIVTNEEGEEEEIEVPEALDEDLDSLLQLYSSQVYLQVDSNCNLPNINPVYEKEVYMQRLKMLPTIMEMPYNDVVQKFIDRYSGKLRRTVSLVLGAQNFYMPIFEQALETYGLPLELKYLPVIESALNPKAVSRVGATGLWQFMLATGKQYGLEVNSLVDERRDPIRSSYAAARYLRDLYRIFNDWNLVIAAYNCGPENINKAVHRAGGVKDYWHIYPYLPSETRGYVPAFIAANYIMNYYCEHNICPMLSRLPVKTDTVVVNRDIHFEQIVAVTGIPLEQLQELNPQYRRNIVNGNNKPSVLRMPPQYITAFIDQEDSVYNYNPELLTKRLEVAVNDDVPMYSSRKSSRSRSRATRRGSSRSRSITIRKGQTLSEIARRNHTTVDRLRRLNGIRGNNIRAGKKLRVK